MLKNRFLLVGLLVTLGLLLYFTLFDSQSGDSFSPVAPETYARQLLAERQKKDDFYRTSADSPVLDKAAFRNLTYYNPDLTYRITARLEPFADKTQKLVVRLTDGSEEVYEKYAYAIVPVANTIHRLLVVRHDKTLSILFKDATSGRETYGGGRYIDLDADAVQGNQVVLDFNTAYNPYCALNTNYACPLPPAENVLPVAIRAGETYTAH